MNIMFMYITRHGTTACPEGRVSDLAPLD
jgi:hypothetical protein